MGKWKFKPEKHCKKMRDGIRPLNSMKRILCMKHEPPTLLGGEDGRTVQIFLYYIPPLREVGIHYLFNNASI